MKLAVFGATGGTGREVVALALRAGHGIRALVRTSARTALPFEVGQIEGNVVDAERVCKTVEGADAVLSCLGARPAAAIMRRDSIATKGTRRIVAAMRGCNVRRLIVLSTYGAGESLQRLKPGARLVMGSVLCGELADKNGMEALLHTSGLDWTILRPVNLTYGLPTGRWRIVDPSCRLGLGDRICRADVAACMLAMLADPGSIGRTLVIAGARS